MSERTIIDRRRFKDDIIIEVIDENGECINSFSVQPDKAIEWYGEYFSEETLSILKNKKIKLREIKTLI